MNHVKRYGLAAATATIGLLLIFTAHAQNPKSQSIGVERNGFNLVPASDTIAACLPNATARVNVISTEELLGVDTMDLRAEGLPPNTSFTVFLTELPDPPFGAAQYIGEFTTNTLGVGILHVGTIIDEAFSSTIAGGVRVRKDLNHVVIWFADPAADDSCFAPGTGPTTPFDGDGQAGAAVLSSRNSLPGAPLP